MKYFYFLNYRIFIYLFFLLGISSTSIPKNEKLNKQIRLLVFVPSISVSENIRNSINDFQSVQNQFISIIYQLVDPFLYILYVTPVHFSPEEIELHNKLLLELNINIMGIYGKRLNFIYPENIKRLPKKMNLSQILLYSSSSMKKIKNYIKKFSNVFYLPSFTSLSFTEKKLSILLNIPVLCLEPTFCQKISSLSFMKKVIVDLCAFFYIN